MGSWSSGEKKNEHAQCCDFICGQVKVKSKSWVLQTHPSIVECQESERVRVIFAYEGVTRLGRRPGQEYGGLSSFSFWTQSHRTLPARAGHERED
jgi:hypothetical protein